MSEPRDSRDDMRRYPIDDATAERLLAGNVSPADAPPGYAGVAAMVQTMVGPASPAELAGEATVVAAGMAALLAEGGLGTNQHSIPQRRKSMLAKLLSAKVAAIAALTLAGATTAAAAAMGSLPAPAQTAVSNAASHVGISVPEPDDQKDTTSTTVAKTDSTDSSTSTNNPSGNTDQGANDTHANFGQCTAFLAGHDTSSSTSTTSPKYNSTDFADFIKDHGGSVASTTSFCQNLLANTTHGNKPSNPGQGNKPSQANKGGETNDSTSSTEPDHTGDSHSSATPGSQAPGSGEASSTGTSAAGSHASGGSGR